MEGYVSASARRSPEELEPFASLEPFSRCRTAREPSEYTTLQRERERERERVGERKSERETAFGLGWY